MARERCMQHPRYLQDREQGSATVEFAVALPAVIMLLLLAVSLVAAGFVRASAQETSRSAARLAALGGTGEQVLAQTVSSPKFTVHVTTTDEWVTATVSAPVTIVGVQVPGLKVSASTTAYREAATSTVPDGQ